MESTPSRPEFDVHAALVLVNDMIEQQRAKCLRLARRLVPHLTNDDVMNPFDWPEVNENPQYCWEDGLLAGLQAASAAIHARLAEEAAANAPRTP